MGQPLSPQLLELLVGAMPGLLILSSGETAPGRGTVARRGTPQWAGGRGCCAGLPMSSSSLEGGAGSPRGPGSAHRAERTFGGSAIFWGPFGSHAHGGAGRQLEGAHMGRPQVKSERVKGPSSAGMSQRGRAWSNFRACVVSAVWSGLDLPLVNKEEATGLGREAGKPPATPPSLLVQLRLLAPHSISPGTRTVDITAGLDSACSLTSAGPACRHIHVLLMVTRDPGRVPWERTPCLHVSGHCLSPSRTLLWCQGLHAFLQLQCFVSFSCSFLIVEFYSPNKRRSISCQAQLHKIQDFTSHPTPHSSRIPLLSFMFAYPSPRAGAW